MAMAFLHILVLSCTLSSTQRHLVASPTVLGVLVAEASFHCLLFPADPVWLPYWGPSCGLPLGLGVFPLALVPLRLPVLPGIPATSPGSPRPSAYRPFPLMILLASLLRALPDASFLTPSASLLYTFTTFHLLPGEGWYFLLLLLGAFC